MFANQRWKKLGACCVVVLLPLNTFPQLNKGISYQVEASTSMSSGKHTPYFLVANRYGLSSIERNNAYVSAGLFRTMDSNSSTLQYAFGLELAAAHRFTSSFVVQQAYADLHYRGMELSVGSKERGSELKNDELSSGGLTISTNARPVPQVRFSIPEYLPVPFTHQWLHFKGHLAYGRFTDDAFQEEYTQKQSKYTNGALYHSKAFFLKVEQRDCPVNVVAGLEMAAQFGGDCYYPGGTVIHNPARIKDFFRVLIPSSGGGDATSSDQINILGNHLGSYHLSAEYRSKRDWKVRAYYEHFFEDASGMGLTYGLWKDGLTGLEVTLPKNPVVTTIVAEYLYTKEQTGTLHYLDGVEPPALNVESYTGADNFYNNGQYAGWEHWGMGMGNPMLQAPIYNGNGDLSFESNRVEGVHIGLCGAPTAELRYRLLLSFAAHWGTYGVPYATVRHNKNLFAELSYAPHKAKGWSFTLAGAIDGGDLLGRSVGGMITLRKTGLIGK